MFVLSLLRLERAESSGVSAAAWIPTIWTMAISGKSLGIWFGLTGSNESGSWPDQVLLMGLTVAGVAVLTRRRYDWQGTLRRNGWLLALLAYMLVSTVWSDITSIALRRWVRDSIVVIMALVLMSEPHPREALESVLRRSAYVLIPFSLLLIKYYPALGVAYAPWSGLRMWVGVSVHKNAFSCLCLVSVFFLLWALYRRWRGRATAGWSLAVWADVSVLLIALFLLKGEENAYSATSLATIAVGVSGLVGLLWLRKLKLAVSLVALLAVVTLLIGFGASAPFLGGSNVAAFSSSLGRDETLTGRTHTWAQLVPVVMSRPLFGCGFGSFWTTARREFYEMSHGHNGYLDTLLELGTVGLAFYICWLLSCARKLHGSLVEDYDWASLGICFLLMALVYNTTESAFTLADDLIAVVVLVSLVVPSGSISTVGRSRLRARPRSWHRRFVAVPPVQSGAKTDCTPVQATAGGEGTHPVLRKRRGFLA